MLAFLPRPLIGCLSALYLALNTVLTAPVFFGVALLKLVVPLDRWRRWCTEVLNQVALHWIRVNNWGLALTKRIRWHVVDGLPDLSPRRWYLVLANHQSWTDVVVLQKIFHGKLPMLKFFAKQELLWVPVLGLAWWAMDFPFVKRYSRAFLAKHPHRQGQDLEATRKVFSKFHGTAIAVMNFVEGTRFNWTKHRQQRSPYRRLLRPKAGGVAFVLDAMGDKIQQVLDVTIAYPRGAPSFLSFLCAKTSEVYLHVRQTAVPEHLRGDYLNDPVFRERFQTWMNSVWQQKDSQLQLLIEQPSTCSAVSLAS